MENNQFKVGDKVMIYGKLHVISVTGIVDGTVYAVGEHGAGSFPPSACEHISEQSTDIRVGDAVSVSVTAPWNNGEEIYRKYCRVVSITSGGYIDVGDNITYGSGSIKKCTQEEEQKYFK